MRKSQFYVKNYDFLQAFSNYNYMRSNAAIVIPIYKSDLEWYEKISLERALCVFKKILFFI